MSAKFELTKISWIGDTLVQRPKNCTFFLIKSKNPVLCPIFSSLNKWVNQFCLRNAQFSTTGESYCKSPFFSEYQYLARSSFSAYQILAFPGGVAKIKFKIVAKIWCALKFDHGGRIRDLILAPRAVRDQILAAQAGHVFNFIAYKIKF